VNGEVTCFRDGGPWSATFCPTFAPPPRRSYYLSSLTIYPTLQFYLVIFGRLNYLRLRVCSNKRPSCDLSLPILLRKHDAPPARAGHARVPTLSLSDYISSHHKHGTQESLRPQAPDENQLLACPEVFAREARQAVPFQGRKQHPAEAGFQQGR
jgi:hypothetical protein